MVAADRDDLYFAKSQLATVRSYKYRRASCVASHRQKILIKLKQNPINCQEDKQKDKADLHH